MSDDDQQKPQWKQAADAVTVLGGKANAREVWEFLKRIRPDIPFSTVTADLSSISVNAPARTSYGMGKVPRRTDGGNRYDLLFKLGVGKGSYFVPYDPKVHGVWEIYADPAATSTNKTSIRQVGDIHFNAQVAMDYLDNRYPATRSGTTHIVAYRNRAGRPLAFDPGKDPHTKNAVSLFLDACPPCPPADSVTEYAPDKSRNHHLAAHAPELASGHWAYTAAVSSLAGLRALCEWYDAAGSDEASQTSMAEPNPMTLPINRILFGPPGTGKTYRTINEALRILDAPFLAANETDRAALKQRFDALTQAGLIRFVTFHQSFSYEDFVEGIRASTDEETGGLRYEVEDGIFKQVCEAARSRNIAETGAGVDITGRRIWKLSLGDANTEGQIYEECIADGIALLGFGAGADLSGIASREDIVKRMQAAGEQVSASSYAVTALNLFIRVMKQGDLVVVTKGNLKFRAIGEVTGDYVHLDRDDVDTYAQGRPVRWLRQYDPALPYADLMENRFSQMTIYELRSGSINLERLTDLLAPEQTEAREPEARVLIIDEINRGNISRIFGELITLIEPSKREGCVEALSVTLPYSKERFSVPRNVHLIGTMNTADRSLAGLDVALRRRFEFVEMLPNTEVLAGVVVAGVSVAVLLATMNRRIEVLLGRDYMLGHAYFLGLTNSSTLSELAKVFRRQVLPLLQEYFFEDWQKIAWVLNDHRKPANLQFVQQVTTGITELLGNDVELPSEGRVWTINAAAFDQPGAYQLIIKAAQDIA